MRKKSLKQVLFLKLFDFFYYTNFAQLGNGGLKKTCLFFDHARVNVMVFFQER